MRKSRNATARRSSSKPILIGVDTGGTFTDLVALDGNRVVVHKTLSTPDDPARAVISGIAQVLGGRTPHLVTYSSTVATNALLEGKGARVALVTNAGLEDLIEIGRQNRDDLYALAPTRPRPLVARNLRFGISERTLFDGTALKKVSQAELKRLFKLIERSGAESVAICMLHAYANPESEETIATELAALDLPLSVSHRILPEYREFERLSTTVVNSYVAPPMATHLAKLERQAAPARLRVMQSNGSAIGAARIREEPVRTLLSGPAAGVEGAAALIGAIGLDRFVTFDMGGTSTDVSLIDRHPSLRSMSYPAGYAVRTPMIDIHTVGAGGGSIAMIDSGGSLQVGPESAGADPGPACYGRGRFATVTDADLIAGRLVPEHFLGGQMKLYPDRAEQVFGQLAQAMGTSTQDAAQGVIRVVNANMERAIRVITVERGFDPRRFALMAFGGAGAMHACELALALGIRHVVLPRNPGLLCAWGALGAPLGREFSLTVREIAPAYDRLRIRARPMIQRANRELVAEGAKPREIRHDLFADLRYQGQSYELTTALTPNFIEDFHAAHRRAFGQSAPGAPVEAVNLRVRSRAARPPIAPARLARRTTPPKPLSLNNTILTDRTARIPVYDRQSFGAGLRMDGPFISVELSTTAYVSPEFRMRVDDFGNIHLEA
jgi:N-methylhydantoinase A/oxoprolinase/acetone carboxylase beta subunit